LGYPSAEYIYLLGGALYSFETDGDLGQPQPVSTYTQYGQTVSSSNSIVNTVYNSASGTMGIGNIVVPGSVSKGSGSFKIDHPLPELEQTHHLVHSFIEGPQADLIYRGQVALVNGSAEVNIDSAAGMTEGTFEALCRDVQCFTTNESNWDLIKGSVTGNILTITAQDAGSVAIINWLVIGERKDKHMIETGWTDANGKVIVEPVKSLTEPENVETEDTSLQNPISASDTSPTADSPS
jgi:hypothetical protein